MPKLIRVQPSAEIPSRVPYGGPSALAFGPDYGVIAESVGQIGRTANQIADAQRRVQNALIQEDMKLNLAETMAALKDEYAKRDIDTRSRLGNPYDPTAPTQPGQPQPLDPTQYHPTMAQAGSDLLRQYEQRLKYPESRAQFRQYALPFLTEQGTKARYEGFKLQQAMLETREGVLLEQDATQAVVGPTEEARRKAFSDGLGRIRSGVESGRYSGQQGEAKLRGFLGTVDRGTAMRDFRNPDLRATVMDRLLSGTFSQHMAPDDQFNLARTMQSQYDAQVAKQEAAEAKALKTFQQSEDLDMFIRAQQKDITPAEVYTRAQRAGLKREDVAAITHELAKPAVETPSDPATRDRVSADVNSMRPTMSEDQIKRFHRSGALNTTDRNEFLAKRTARITHLQEYGHTLEMQQHSQAMTELKTIFGIPDVIPDNFDPKRLQGYSAAVRELGARSNAFPGGKEPPLDALDKIRPRAQQLVDQQIQLDYSQADKLAVYKTMADLMAAKPTMSTREYQIQREYTQRLVDLQQENLRKSATPPTAGGKPRAAPKKGTALPQVK